MLHDGNLYVDRFDAWAENITGTRAGMRDEGPGLYGEPQVTYWAVVMSDVAPPRFAECKTSEESDDLAHDFLNEVMLRFGWQFTHGSNGPGQPFSRLSIRVSGKRVLFRQYSSIDV